MIEINNEVKKIMELVEASGYEIYLVGGFVRDSIIGKDNKDYDLCTNMPFNKLSELIPEMKVMRENRADGFLFLQEWHILMKMTKVRLFVSIGFILILIMMIQEW